MNKRTLVLEMLLHQDVRAILMPRNKTVTYLIKEMLNKFSKFANFCVARDRSSNLTN